MFIDDHIRNSFFSSNDEQLTKEKKNILLDMFGMKPYPLQTIDRKNSFSLMNSGDVMTSINEIVQCSFRILSRKEKSNDV